MLHLGDLAGAAGREQEGGRGKEDVVVGAVRLQQVRQRLHGPRCLSERRDEERVRRHVLQDAEDVPQEQDVGL